MVLMHGYGLGLGCYFGQCTNWWCYDRCYLLIIISHSHAANVDSLAHHFDRIIAIDWPGMGCSDQSTYKSSPVMNLLNSIYARASSRSDDMDDEAQSMTDFYIDSLERIRIEENVSRFTLAGHSLGGYLSARYALKYPQRVSNLILISPVGIPEHPPLSSQVEYSKLDWKVKLALQMWKYDWRPQSILRTLGSRGPQVVSDIITGRFGSRWSEVEMGLVSDYMYHITAAPASGRNVLNTLLQAVFVDPHRDETPDKHLRSGVYAKLPLERDLCGLSSWGIPILLLFGDKDWMGYPSAQRSVERWNLSAAARYKESATLSPGEKGGGGGGGGVAAQLLIVPGAGHHLYLDNPDFFNRAVADWVSLSAD